MMMKIA